MNFDKKTYNNAFWMMSEKIISILGLFFVTSFVAKYVGPSVFGEISLAIAIFQVVQIIAQMGGDDILFKRISENELSGVTLMKASTLLRGGAYFFLSICVVSYFYFFVEGNAFYYILAVSIAYFFSAIDVALIYNNAMLISKLNTIANVIGLFFGLLIRYVIAYLELNPLYLSVPIVLTTLIPFIIRLIIFERKKNNIFPDGYSININKMKKYSKYMFLAGVGIVAASISVAVYSRVNQFTLGAVDGTASVGVYSVALTLSTSWGFVSQALITSFYSKIYSTDDRLISLEMAAKLNQLVFFISLAFISLIVIFGQFVLTVLYGDEYSSAYIPMVILCIGSMLSSLGTVSYRYIIKLSGYYFLSRKMFLLLIISLPLSYFSILYYGIIGASVSFVIVELLSLTVMNYFFSNGVIWKMHKMSFAKWRVS